MKSFIYILLMMMSLSTQSQSKKERIVLSRAELLQSTVFTTKDSAVLDKLFAKTLHYQHSGGKVETREQALHNISHNKSTYVESTPVASAYKVVADGANFVVTHNFVAIEKKADGSETKLDLNIATTWVKEKGQWKLSRRVATKNIH